MEWQNQLMIILYNGEEFVTKTKKKLIIITLEMEQSSPIIIMAPDSWGNDIIEIANRLSEELNNEEDVFIAINNKVIRRAQVKGAVIQFRSVN